MTAQSGNADSIAPSPFPSTMRSIRTLFLLLVLAITGPVFAKDSTIKLNPHFLSSTSASGSTPELARTLTIFFSSDFVGTLDGKAITGAIMTHPVTWNPTGEHPLHAMTYTRSAGTIYILYTLE